MNFLFSPSTPSPPPRLSLLGLPAELRTQILAHALTSPTPIVAFRLDPYQSDAYTEARPPPLTSVNRQLRAESLPLWYESNAIVLHTEGGKGEQARKWLRRFEAHLPLLRHVEIWLRYAAVMPYRAPSQGVIAVRLQRHPAREEGLWKVVQGKREWEWVTVVRRPRDLERDGWFLVGVLKRLLVEQGRGCLQADGLWELMVELRMWYVKEKLDN